MLPALFINEKEVDVIELFDEYLIVQEVISHEIYSIFYCAIDTVQCRPSGDKIDNSNVISLQWHRKIKNG